MQILLALIAGAVIGAAAHFTLAGRDLRGVALGPILGTAVAGAVWTICTWTGLGIDSPWPWIAAIVVPAAVVFPAVALLTRTRRRADEAARAAIR